MGELVDQKILAIREEIDLLLGRISKDEFRIKELQVELMKLFFPEMNEVEEAMFAKATIRVRLPKDFKFEDKHPLDLTKD